VEAAEKAGGQVTAIRVIPTLPAEFDGEPVEWTRWTLAPVLSHVPSGCFTCDHEGPLSLAFGFCGSARPRRRLLAVRCRRCQETRVSTFRPFPDGMARVVKERAFRDLVPKGTAEQFVPDGVVERVVHGEQVEVAYFAPQALGEEL
jgi:hypothetical protein